MALRYDGVGAGTTAVRAPWPRRAGSPKKCAGVAQVSHESASDSLECVEQRQAEGSLLVRTAELLDSFDAMNTDEVFAGPESHLDDFSTASSILSLSGDVVANHPTMGTCGCPVPPQPNTPPSPCGC